MKALTVAQRRYFEGVRRFEMAKKAKCIRCDTIQIAEKTVLGMLKDRWRGRGRACRRRS